MVQNGPWCHLSNGEDLLPGDRPGLRRSPLGTDPKPLAGAAKDAKAQNSKPKHSTQQLLYLDS